MPGSLKFSGGWAIVRVEPFLWGQPVYCFATLHPNGGTRVWRHLNKSRLEDWTEEATWDACLHIERLFFGFEWGKFEYLMPKWAVAQPTDEVLEP